MPNPRHLRDDLAQLDRADRVVGILEVAMQPNELKFWVGQGLRRQHAACMIGCIDDNALDALGAVGQDRDLQARADHKPGHSGIEPPANRRRIARVHDDMQRVDSRSHGPVEFVG